MKKTLRILLSAALVLCMAFAAVGCGDDGEKPDKEPPAPVKYEVTVVNGKLSNGYNHDYVTEGTTVTVTADPSADFEQGFTAWKDGPDIVSTEATYTFAVSKDVTLMAEYGSNYSVWDGQYPETAPAGYVVDEANKQVHIQSAAALAYWSRMVANNDDGTPANNDSPFSTLRKAHYNNYMNGKDGAGNYTDASRKEALKQTNIYNPENKWTVSIECNIDLGGEMWKPIVDTWYSLNDITIEGNNHIIKNLYPDAHLNNEYGSVSGSAGFFGQVSASMTVQNLTFDGAVVEIEGTGSNYQNQGVVFGYLNGNNQNVADGTMVLDTPQTVVLDNVNVINSKILGSARTLKNGMLIAHIGDPNGYAAFKDSDRTLMDVTIKNCTVSDCKIVAAAYGAALVGQVWIHDNPNGIDNEKTIRLAMYNNAVRNFTTVLSGDDGRTVTDGAVSAAGKIDTNVTVGSNATVWETTTKVNIYNDFHSPVVKSIDLNVGSGARNGNVAAFSQVNTNAQMFIASLTYKDADEAYMVKDVFVANDITLNANQIEALDNAEWVKGDQVIYLVDGAILNADGVDFGDFRYINGDRDENGDLIVYSDAEHTTRIGVWKTTDSLGAYVADGAANS